MTRIVAMMVVWELDKDRYLVPCVDHLLDFCDEVVMLLDGDRRWWDDLVGAWGDRGSKVTGIVRTSPDRPSFAEHEGRARQHLYDLVHARATHILAIDADEFISDGAALRQAAEERPEVPVWGVPLEEVWELDGDCLCVREDGGWCTHSVGLFFRPQPNMTFRDLKLACPRAPIQAEQQKGEPAPTELLHFGWTNEAERQGRFDRYMAVDGGLFHARTHLESIRYPSDRITLRGRSWPVGLRGYQERITMQATRQVANGVS